jgi:hypothetical protein
LIILEKSSSSSEILSRLGGIFLAGLDELCGCLPGIAVVQAIPEISMAYAAAIEVSSS